MKYGIYQRTTPRVNVIRGYTGNESSGLTTSATIDAAVTLGTLKSGMIISLSASTGAWVLGGQAGLPVFIAMQDDTDSDVVSSGRVLGLSCSGNFEVQTPFFTAGTYNNGTPLTWDASTPGNITVTPGGGKWTGTPSVDIIGYCSQAKVDLNVGGPGGGWGTKTIANVANAGIDSQALPVSGHTYVIQWITRWAPAREVSAAQT